MILLTGYNGFLGKEIYNQLKSSYEIDTLSRSNSIFNIDLVKNIPSFNSFYSIVIHAAGKAHIVPKTKREEQLFSDVNVTGTKNLLQGLEMKVPSTFIYISSVAVYGLEVGENISEDYPLLAVDAYGKSKIQAELIVQEWCEKNNVICSILRLPLLVGPNPPGNLGSMIKAIKHGYYFNIDGGKAKRSMVLANDVGQIIPTVAQIGGIYNLTDGYNPTFKELSELMSSQLGKSTPFSIPKNLAKIMAKIGDFMSSNAPINSNKLNKITSDLTYDNAKAQNLLDWKPTQVLLGFKVNTNQVSKQSIL